MSLNISQDLVDAMVLHAQHDEPDEACGVLSGPIGQDRPTRFIPMENGLDLDSTSGYAFDDRQQLAVWQGMEDRDEECKVIYHSHTAHPAVPSERDIKGAFYDVHYVIISTITTPPSVRSYRIVNGMATEEDVVIS